MKQLIPCLLCLLIGAAARAQEVPSEYQQVLTTLGKSGDYKANVLKVNIPRTDLNVTVANVKTPTPFGFGAGWRPQPQRTTEDGVSNEFRDDVPLPRVSRRRGR